MNHERPTTMNSKELHPWRLGSICLLAFTCLAASVLAQTPIPATNTPKLDGKIGLSLRSGSYEILPVGDGQVIIEMEDFGQTGAPGDPKLPVHIYDVALPPDVDPASVRLEIYRESLWPIPGHHVVAPAPPWQEGRKDPDWGPDKVIVDGRNVEIYGRDVDYPARTAEVLGQAQMRKWRFLKLAYYPVRYNPQSSRLWIAEGEAVIYFERGDEHAPAHGAVLRDQVLDRHAQERFVNYETAAEWYRLPPPPPGSAPLPTPLTTDYVIVTTSAIVKNSRSLDAFKDHKESLGHTVAVITEADYGNMKVQPPAGRAEKIRMWLDQQHQEHGIEWVLLIGNPDPGGPTNTVDDISVPMKMTWPNYRGDSKIGAIPTDYYYADLNGDWDLDGDGRYGETRTLPTPSMKDYFSIIWEGEVEIDTSETWSFQTVSNNGVELWIDDELKISHWQDDLSTEEVTLEELSSGRHKIKLKYYENEGNAWIKLRWRKGDGKFRLIPANKLYYENRSGQFVPGGLKGTYFAGKNFEEKNHVSVDPQINFDWGYSGPSLSRVGKDGEDGFAVRWEGELAIGDYGDYTFHLLSDDGAKMWLQKSPLIDSWGPHEPTTASSAPQQLQPGRYPISVDFWKDKGDAVCYLYWSYRKAPFQGLNPDKFAVRWTGKLKVDEAGKYSFHTRSDDGVRLWIDSDPDPVIENWTHHAAAWDDGDSIQLSVGEHDIVLEFYENTGRALIELYWTPPGADDKEIIPKSALCHYETSSGHCVPGLEGKYFQWTDPADVFDSAGFVKKRFDKTVSFDWDEVNETLVPGKGDAMSQGLMTPFGAKGLLATYYDDATFKVPKGKAIDHSLHMYWGTGDASSDKIGVDFAPEVFVGRIPVYLFFNKATNQEEPEYTALDKILEKIRAYESQPRIPEWRRRLLFSAVHLHDTTNPGSDYVLGEALRDQLAKPLRFDIYRIYEEDFGLSPECSPINPVEEDLKADCNFFQEWVHGKEYGKGYGLVGWGTHGGPTWAWNVIFSDKVENTKEFDDAYPSFTFQGSCSTGYPENPGNLGYTLLKKGAIGTVSASRGSGNTPLSVGEKPEPINGSNCSLNYFYFKRLMNGFPAGPALYLTKENVIYDERWNNKLVFNLYGDPATTLLTPYKRGPVDVVLVMDQSGSMDEPTTAASGSDKKVEALRSAAKLFLDILDTEKENQLGLVAFSHEAETLMALQPFNSGARETAHGRLDSLDPSGRTSVGGGLSKALTELRERSVAGHRRIVFLVTDGKENTAPWIDPVADLLKHENVAVFSLGLGHSWGLDETRLTALSAQTGGDFRVTDDDLVFRKFFLEMLGGSALAWDVVMDPIHDLEQGETVSIPVPVGCDDRELLVSAYWSGQDEAVELTVESPPPTVVYTSESSSYLGRERYALHRIDLAGLPRGTWQMKLTGKSASSVRASASAMVRSGTGMKAGLSHELIRTGDSNALRVALRQDGRALPGARIVAELDQPKEWIGNLLYRHAGDFPRRPKDLRPTVDRARRRVATLQARLGKRLIEREQRTIELFDDGQHSDLEAGDGIYAADVGELRVPGLYRARFLATDIPSCGSVETTREWTHSFHTAVDVQGSTLDLKLIRKGDDEYRLKALPRDRFGNYLGPGERLTVTIDSPGGPGEVILEDLLSGSYAAEFSVSTGFSWQDATWTVDVDGASVVPEKSPAESIRQPVTWSLHLGRTVPHGTFGRNLDPDFSLTLDVGYRLRPQFSLVGLLSYHHFDAGAPSLDDTTWWSLSVNGRYKRGSGLVRPYIQGGLGLYLPESGSTKAGANLGVGLEFTVRPEWTVELGVDRHLIDTSPHTTEFTVTHLGLIYRF